MKAKSCNVHYIFLPIGIVLNSLHHEVYNAGRHLRFESGLRIFSFSKPGLGENQCATLKKYYLSQHKYWTRKKKQRSREAHRDGKFSNRVYTAVYIPLEVLNLVLEYGPTSQNQSVVLLWYTILYITLGLPSIP